MGILCGHSLSVSRSPDVRYIHVCVHVGELVRGGRFYFTRIIIPLEDCAPILHRVESRRGEASRARLFMDGFSFNFRQGRAAAATRSSSFCLPSLLAYRRSVLTRVAVIRRGGVSQQLACAPTLYLTVCNAKKKAQAVLLKYQVLSRSLVLISTLVQS